MIIRARAATDKGQELMVGNEFNPLLERRVDRAVEEMLVETVRAIARECHSKGQSLSTILIEIEGRY